MYRKPSNRQFQNIFDHIAHRYDLIINSYAIGRRIEFFQKYARGKCLEVGAGTGEISKALRAKHTVVATDLSPVMVKQIKQKLKIKALAADAEKLPFKSNQFDTIIGSEMIYYLDHPENFIREAHRVLKPGGRLLLSSANETTKVYDTIRGLLRKIGLKSMYFDDQNRQFFTSYQLAQLLNNHFKVKLERRIIIIPYQGFEILNRFLEKTPLSKVAAFIMIYAEKVKTT